MMVEKTSIKQFLSKRKRFLFVRTF